MNDTSIPYFEDEQSKLLPDLPIVERNTINAIIYNRAKDEVLCLDWPKFDWHTFVIGGIEGEENPIDSATREILEETGYKNIKFISETGRTRSGYYAAHKKENRISNAVGLLFELIDEDMETTTESETTNHVVKWIKKNEVTDFINLDSQRYIWKKALEILNN